MIKLLFFYGIYGKFLMGISASPEKLQSLGSVLVWRCLHLQGWSNVLGHLTGQAKKTGAQIKSPRLTKKQLETLIFFLYYLWPKQDLKVLFLTYFHQIFFSWCFCSLNFVWMSKMGCVSIILILQRHTSTLVLNNMLKVLKFNKNKLRHWCFDSLPKMLRTNRTDTFHSYFHGRFMPRRLIDLNFIFTCYQGDISVWIIKTVFLSLAEVYSEPSLVSKMELIVSIWNSL